MGELILIKSPIAALPYYIENSAINVYSMEELCYYMVHNTYILDHEFMNEELCTWIEQEQGYAELAKDLRSIKNTTRSLKDFVLRIEKEIGYATTEQLNQMQEEFLFTEDKTDFECKKLRIDKMMGKKKYWTAIEAYTALLETEEKPGGDLIGNVWHNLGTAYARLFLFQEAAYCYRTAYEWNQNEESLKEYLMTFRCMRDEEGFQQTAKQNCIDEDKITQLKEELSEVSSSEQIISFRKKLEKLMEQKDFGKKEEYETGYWNIVNEWKNEYRRICRK